MRKQLVAFCVIIILKFTVATERQHDFFQLQPLHVELSDEPKPSSTITGFDFGGPSNYPGYVPGTNDYTDICGIPSKFPEDEENDIRIAGGTPTLPNQYPWLAAIVISHKYFCTGSLIGSNWILTAGHCCDVKMMNITNPEFTVYLGVHNLTDRDEPHRVVLTSSEYYINPQFSLETMVGDIALIKLPDNVNFTDRIRPACVISTPSNISSMDANPFGDSSPNLVGQRVTFVGFGKISSGSQTISPVAMQATISVVSSRQCDLAYQTHMDSSIMCTSDMNNEQGPCNGDSGGPVHIVTNTTVDGRRVMVNVCATSFGGASCETYPSGCTKLFHLYNTQWLETISGIVPLRLPEKFWDPFRNVTRIASEI